MGFVPVPILENGSNPIENVLLSPHPPAELWPFIEHLFVSRPFACLPPILAISDENGRCSIIYRGLLGPPKWPQFGWPFLPLCSLSDFLPFSDLFHLFLCPNDLSILNWISLLLCSLRTLSPLLSQSSADLSFQKRQRAHTGGHFVCSVFSLIFVMWRWWSHWDIRSSFPPSSSVPLI